MTEGHDWPEIVGEFDRIRREARRRRTRRERIQLGEAIGSNRRERRRGGGERRRPLSSDGGDLCTAGQCPRCRVSTPRIPCLLTSVIFVSVARGAQLGSALFKRERECVYIAGWLQSLFCTRH